MEEETHKIKSIFKWTAISSLILLGLIAFFWAITTIEAGTVGVVKQFGQVTGKTLEPGFHVITPFVDKVVVYNTKKVIYETTSEDKQKGSEANYKDYPVDTNTKDGQQVDVYYTVRFSIDPTMATFVTQNIGSEGALVDKIVKTESRIWARNIPREFEAEELYSGEGAVKVQNKVESILRPVFQENGIILDSVGIREIKFTDQYVQAIESKQIEAVKIETERNKAEQEKFKKDASITNAEAQAQAQKLQRETISAELLQKLLIEKWSGNYPQYLVITEGNDFILPLPNQ
jgi:regulator of protease activity HflC (stomatin/prohibitin superfamily)